MEDRISHVRDYLTDHGIDPPPNDEICQKIIDIGEDYFVISAGRYGLINIMKLIISCRPSTDSIAQIIGETPNG